MPKFLVCLYQETYSDIEVEAGTREEAIDVQVATSEVISTTNAT